MPFRYAYLLLVLAAILSGWATYLALLPGGTRTVRVRSPILVHAPCMQKAVGPTPVYGCRDGTSWAHQSNGWRNLGAGSPLPGVPLR